MVTKKKKKKKKYNPVKKGTVTRDRLRSKAPILKKLIFQSRFIPSDIDKPTKAEDAGKPLKEHSAIETILFFGDEVPAVSEEQIYDFCYDCVTQGKEEVLKRIKHTRGTKTTYKPWIHIPMVLNRMSRGCSQVELALEIGVMPYMINKWKNVFPSFKQACDEGYKLSEAWWFKVGRANLANSKFNNNLYANQMATRFGHSTKTVNHKGTVGVNHTGTVSHEHKHVVTTLRDTIQNLPISELEKLTEILDLGPVEELRELPEDFEDIDYDKEAEEALEEIEEVNEVREEWRGEKDEQPS